MLRFHFTLALLLRFFPFTSPRRQEISYLYISCYISIIQSSKNVSTYLRKVHISPLLYQLQLALIKLYYLISHFLRISKINEGWKSRRRRGCNIMSRSSTINCWTTNSQSSPAVRSLFITKRTYSWIQTTRIVFFFKVKVHLVFSYSVSSKSGKQYQIFLLRIIKSQCSIENLPFFTSKYPQRKKRIYTTNFRYLIYSLLSLWLYWRKMIVFTLNRSPSRDNSK